MDTSTVRAGVAGGRQAALICTAALLGLAVAMGVGRFAFTPLFPLMVRDGLLDSQAGAWLAAANYLGYLVGALAAGAPAAWRPAPLLALRPGRHASRARRRSAWTGRCRCGCCCASWPA